MEKQWIINEYPEEVALHLREVLGIHPVLCKILASRGIRTFEDARRFFRPDLNQLYNPFRMKGMDAAVQRITKACRSGERIRIYGDYDVDGTTAVSVVYLFLRHHIDESLLSFYIPNRYTEGYGLSKQGIDDAHASGCTLMIVLDCGIRSVELVDYANQLGMDIIICDHHLPGSILPKAQAILNPKQSGCGYPFKELSGCGIGFKLICALQQSWGSDVDPLNYLDLVAASVASDIVPITDENRVLAFYGLKKINESPSLPFQVLKNVSAANRKFNIANLVFLIGPRINAAGRMNDAAKVVRLFISRQEEDMYRIARELTDDNEDRKSYDFSITAEAEEMVLQEHLYERKSIVLHKDGWHKGVLGIVASRLQERFYKPTIVLTSSHGKITGSARSVHGFDIHAALCSCAEYLEQFGGHQFAAGLTLLPTKLPEFIQAFEQVVQASIQEDSLLPRIIIDSPLHFGEITSNLLNIVEQFEPCGPANPAPIFVARNVQDSGSTRIVKDVHLQLHLQQDGIPMKGIAFNMAEQWYDYFKSGRPADIVFHLESNEWNGIVRPEIRVLDIKAAQ